MANGTTGNSRNDQYKSTGLGLIQCFSVKLELWVKYSYQFDPAKPAAVGFYVIELYKCNYSEGERFTLDAADEGVNHSRSGVGTNGTTDAGGNGGNKMSTLMGNLGMFIESDVVPIDKLSSTVPMNKSDPRCNTEMVLKLSLEMGEDIPGGGGKNTQMYELELDCTLVSNYVAREPVSAKSQTFDEVMYGEKLYDASRAYSTVTLRNRQNK
ncbi:unnamed protein product [Ambrosiozyma monospora]|uniref:Unnamed protein product n=1 Tax=Ambrosiozyma monospora TaxID=43982 RepID=A0ACB5T1E1_AMBMO|nr:unnamed protein product [Ambrosiozyma monospora]